MFQKLLSLINRFWPPLGPAPLAPPTSRSDAVTKSYVDGSFR